VSPVEESLRPLLLLGLDGDHAAYAAFLSGASAHLRAYLRRRLTRWPDDVEDVLQETLLALHNQRHTWRRQDLLGPWLHAIARYKLVDALRARAVRDADRVEVDEDALAALVTTDDEAAHARRDVRALVATLPDHFRVPIECVKLDGMSVADTARRTGMSTSAVKVGIHRGLRLLARRLREDPK
jgi:RNA polymerase sigma-70 factor (ECF subfamily)